MQHMTVYSSDNGHQRLMPPPLGGWA